MSLASFPRYDPERVTSIPERAVVIGGSLAGLTAARVLADRYEAVTVLERDSLPDAPTARSGVPQDGHPHLLFEAGQATLEDFFPGFGEQLLSAGGLVIDWSRDLTLYQEGGYVTSGPNRIPMYAASRPLIDRVLRERLRGIDGVEFRWNARFVEYLTDDDGAVDGVSFRPEDGTLDELSASLVVDATGRTSRTGGWLADNGYYSPPTDEVGIDLTYSTLQLERPSDDRRMFFVPPSPPRTGGAGIFPVEDGRWLVTLAGVHDEQPPTDPDRFGSYLGDLPVPDLREVVEAHDRVDDEVHEYRFPTSIWRHYERLEAFPENLVVTGDAVASFNPVYGQGMSVAAMEALQLHHELAETGGDVRPTTVFDRLASIIRIAWQLSVGADFRFPETTGPKPAGTALSNYYLKRLIRGAHTDAVLADRFAKVVMMRDHPKTLLHPNVLRRVLSPFR